MESQDGENDGIELAQPIQHAQTSKTTNAPQADPATAAMGSGVDSHSVVSSTTRDLESAMQVARIARAAAGIFSDSDSSPRSNESYSPQPVYRRPAPVLQEAEEEVDFVVEGEVAVF